MHLAYSARFSSFARFAGVLGQTAETGVRVALRNGDHPTHLVLKLASFAGVLAETAEAGACVALHDGDHPPHTL